MRGVGLRGSQAPLAAAGEVRTDPFPLRRCVLCVELNAAVSLLCALHHRRLVKPVEWEQTLPQFGFSIGVAKQFGSMRADGAGDGAFFGQGN